MTVCLLRGLITRGDAAALKVPLIRWSHTVLDLALINPLPQSVGNTNDAVSVSQWEIQGGVTWSESRISDNMDRVM